MSAAKLGLGTVQWGMPYGIANSTGQAGAAEIAAMLALGAERGVTLLDTARVYGESEAAIGNERRYASRFAVVTKTRPAAGERITAEECDTVAAALQTSLDLLAGWRIHGVLVHHCDNLLRSGGEQIWRLLCDRKAAGDIGKIGVSVQSPDQALRALHDFQPDLIQLPFNIYDQRFLRSGALYELKRAGVEIHARSAFLQGLLLMDAGSLPAYFDPIRAHHARLHRAAAASGLTPLAAALNFCLGQPEIDRVIVGCETASQLREILTAAAVQTDVQGFAAFAIDDEAMVNPPLWRLDK